MSTHTVLVTGATGFIGHHLLSALQKTDWDIISALRDVSKEVVTPSVVVGNINQETNWQKALNGVSAVVHLAARAHQLQDTSPDPEQAFRQVNTEGTANLVKQSIAAGVQHFVLISSIGAMATLRDDQLTVDTPCHPDTPYGRSKLASEQALIKLTQESSMTWSILRPTLVYGPGNPGNMERLMKLINTGFPLPFGSIKNRRSFIYVGNLVDIILRVLTHPNAKNQIFLCSDGQDLSTPNLVRKIAECANQPCRLLAVPPSLLKLSGNAGDIVQYLLSRSFILNSETLNRLTGSLYVDNSNLYSLLDWRPLYSVTDGLSQTFAMDKVS